MKKYYTGIGSRETPVEICELMKQIAGAMEKHGFTLRSGGAVGADSAFEEGATDREIYLPYENFNFKNMVYPIPPEAFDIASTIHPAWDKLPPGPKKMMARNAMQILGHDLAVPTKVVVCWTADGCISEAERTRKTGGTGQAIAQASRLGIDVFNLQRVDHYERLRAFVANNPF